MKDTTATPEKKTRQRRLTLKQKRCIHEYFKTGNKTEAGRRAYDVSSDATAIQAASRALETPQGQAELTRLMNEGGLSDEELVSHSRKILKASTGERSLRKVSPSDGVRLIETAYKIKHQLAKLQQPSSYNLTINVKDKTNQQLIQLLDDTIKEANRFKKLVTDNPYITEETIDDA